MSFINSQWFISPCILGHWFRTTREGGRTDHQFRGWGPADDDFTWIDGVEAEWRFNFPRPTKQHIFRADVHPFEAALPQSLTVYFNYFRVGYFELTEDTQIEVELPPELFIKLGCSLILHCPTAVPAQSVGLDDPRRLGVAVSRWRIE